MSEEMVNLSVYDTLSLARDNPITDRLKTLPRPPFFMDPSDALPIWLTRPLNDKMPMTGIPRRFQVPYTRGTLGENLVHSLDPNHFVIYDPHGYDIRYEYAPLHDKHLKGFFTKPVTKALVEKTNEVRNGRTVCTLKEYNDYRKYIHKIQLHYVTQELQNEENLRKEELGVENFMNKAKKEAKDKWNKRLRGYLKEKKLRVEREEQKKKKEKCRLRLERVEKRSAVVKKRLEEERALRSTKWNAYQKKMKDYFKELKDDQRRLGIASRKKWMFEAALNARRKVDNLEENRVKRDIQLEINWERRKKGQMIKLQKDKLCLKQYNRCMEVMRERRQRGYQKDLEMEEMLTLPGMDNLNELRVSDTLEGNYSEEFSKAIRGAKFFVNPRAKQYTLEKALRKYIKHTESPRERLRKAFIVKPIKEAMDLIIRRTVTHYAFVKSYEIIKEMLKGAEHTAEKIKLSQPLRKLLLVEYEKYGPRSNTPYNTLLHFGEDGLFHCICDHRLISKDKLWWPCSLCRQKKPENAFTLDEEDGEEYFESISSDDDFDDDSDQTLIDDSSGLTDSKMDNKLEEPSSEIAGIVMKPSDSVSRKRDLKDARRDEESKGGKMVAFPADGGPQKLASVLPEPSAIPLDDVEKRNHVPKKSRRKRSVSTSKKNRKRRAPSKASRKSQSSMKKNRKKGVIKIRDGGSEKKTLPLKVVTEVHRKSDAPPKVAPKENLELPKPVDEIIKTKEYSLALQDSKDKTKPAESSQNMEKVTSDDPVNCLPKQDGPTSENDGECTCDCPSGGSLNTRISLMSITSDNRLRFVKGEAWAAGRPTRKTVAPQTQRGFVQGKCRCWKRFARSSLSIMDTSKDTLNRRKNPARKHKHKTRWVGKINRADSESKPEIDHVSTESLESEEDEVLVAVCKCGAENCVKKILIDDEEQFERLVKSLEEGEETKKIFLDKEIVKKCRCEKCRQGDEEVSVTKDLQSLSSRSSVRVARGRCRCLKKNLGAYEEKTADKLAYMKKIVGAGKDPKKERQESLTGKVLGETEKRVDPPPRKKSYRKKYREPLIPKKKNKASTIVDLFKRPYPDTEIQKLYVNDEGFLYSLDRRARKTIIAYVGDNLKVDQNGQKHFKDAVDNRYMVDITGRVFCIGEDRSKYSLYCEKGALTVNPESKKDAILVKVRPSILCAVPEGAEEAPKEIEGEVEPPDIERNKYEFIDENRSDDTPTESQVVVNANKKQKEGETSGDVIKTRSNKEKPSVKLAQSLEPIDGILTLADVAQLSGRVPPPRMPIKRPLISLVNEVPRHKAIDQLFIQRNKFEQCARIIARRLLLYSYCKATRLKELGMDKLEELNQRKDKQCMKIDHLVKALTQLAAHYPLKLVTSRRLSVYIDSVAKSMLYPSEYSLFGDSAEDFETKKRIERQMEAITEGTSTSASARLHRSPLSKLFETTGEAQGKFDTAGVISKALMAVLHPNLNSSEQTTAKPAQVLKENADVGEEVEEEEEEGTDS